MKTIWTYLDTNTNIYHVLCDECLRVSTLELLELVHKEGRECEECEARP